MERIERSPRSVWRSPKAHLPFISQMSAAQNFDKRGFAGTVLTDKCVDLPLGYREIHAVERRDAWETLNDPLQLKNGLHSARVRATTVFSVQDPGAVTNLIGVLIQPLSFSPASASMA